MTAQPIATVYRDFETDGVPSSGEHEPIKSNIREWGTYIESQIAALFGGGELQGEWDASAGTFPGAGSATIGQSWIVSTAGTVDGVAFRVRDRVVAIIDNASTATYASNWIRLAAALDPVVHGADSGASTANAIAIDTDYEVSADGGQLIAFVVPVTNTLANVAVAFNGGSGLAIKTAAGNDPEVGALAAGMPLVGQITNSGTWFRLLSDQASAIVLANAEAAAAAAEAWAETAEDVTVESGKYSAKHHAAKAAASATSAADDATTASASAAAAAEAIGADLYDTRADADIGLAGQLEGDFVMVLVDETRLGQRTLYKVVAAAYVFVREVGDQTLSSITGRYGFGRHMRYLLGTAAKLNRDAWGANGPGNPNQFPQALTASQSGTTVTASSAVLWRYHVGAVITWDTGEWARIVSVPTQSANSTMTVDRSQTVANGAAVIDVKPVVGVFQGDSLGHRLALDFKRWAWRSMGFGGEIVMPGNNDATGMMSMQVQYAAGAAVVSANPPWDEYPYGVYASLPSGGSITLEFTDPFSAGVEREFRHSLAIEQMLIDTIMPVWRRGAGAFKVQTRRRQDAEWVDVVTIADASTGSATFNVEKTSIDLRHDWEFRLLGTSGTVNIVAIGLLNLTNPGFVPWRVSRGSYGDSRDLEQFVDLSSSDLNELCQIFMPDARFTLTADNPSSVSDALTWLESSSSLWETAWPHMDHAFMELWENSTSSQTIPDYNTAVSQHCLENDYTFIPLYDFFGDFTTQSAKNGWLLDNVHPDKLGTQMMLLQTLRVTGLDRIPTIAQAQDVNARNVDARFLRINGRDVAAQLKEARDKPVENSRGARWHNITALGSIGGALGTSDFTFSIKFTVLASVTSQYLAAIGADGTSVAQDGGLVVLCTSTDDLIITLRDGSSNVIQYVYDKFGVAFGGQTGTLTIRSDVANGRFDLFWDGEPVYQVTAAIAGTTTSPLGTWSGTGTEFGIPQGNALDRSSDFFSAEFHRSALTDAEIYANAIAGGPTETVPDFWWDFSDGVGRVAHDRTGNGRDGLFRAAGASSAYSIGALPTWRYPRTTGTLSQPWSGSLTATTILKSSDDVIAKYTATRDMQLPATPQVGDQVRVTKATTATVRFSQAALHQIKTGAGMTVGTDATTIGTGGTLTINTSYGSATLICIRAEAGVAYEWAVVASTGALDWI